MGHTLINLIGQRFGRFLVIEFAYIKNGRGCWKCQCDCGEVRIVAGTCLRNGTSKSCGCYAMEHSSIVNSGSGNPWFGKKRPEHSKNMKGRNHPRYNNSLTEEEREVKRTYTKYREWRTAVYERDNYTCLCCATKKAPFNAHHLGAYNKYTTLRLSLWNGVTLCKECHIAFHNKYGRGNNTIKQFIKFLFEKDVRMEKFMILKDINFTDFFEYIRSIFNTHFSYEETAQLMEYVEILADANFRCYAANAVVIENRKTGVKDYDLISAMEWVARSVGEYRVSSKARINLYISRIKSLANPEVHSALDIVKDKYSSWITDDIVYSIGEMIDRLSIETIKREDFTRNSRPPHMIEASKNLSCRVEKYLIQKLEEIDKKGFYECVQEQRTYDIEGILEELVI